MPDDESTSFDPVAEFYDQSSADMFADAVVTPTVDLLAELAGSGRALELGIGTGRIALPLAARGVAVSGIDASQAMVAKLREKPGSSEIPVAIGDYSTASVEGSFSLAYLVFNGLWNLRTQEKQVACFQNVAGHLEAGGYFLIELFVPDLQQISPGNNIKAFRADSHGMSFDVYDVVSQRLTSMHYEFGGRGVRSFASDGRYAWPAEIDLMARLAGMRLRDRWAGWKQEPFTDTSRSHVSVYEKP
ncbi:MAG: class I SAM-dependent methyltransferase [Dehalococcoidia bacterium]